MRRGGFHLARSFRPRKCAVHSAQPRRTGSRPSDRNSDTHSGGHSLIERSTGNAMRSSPPHIVHWYYATSTLEGFSISRTYFPFSPFAPVETSLNVFYVEPSLPPRRGRRAPSCDCKLKLIWLLKILAFLRALFFLLVFFYFTCKYFTEKILLSTVWNNTVETTADSGRPFQIRAFRWHGY